MSQDWMLIPLVSLALIGHANAEDKEADTITVEPNQVVVQVFGIV